MSPVLQVARPLLVSNHVVRRNLTKREPVTVMILVNGWLYGMTTEGGAHGLGLFLR
jgi:hypothetical protein